MARIDHRARLDHQATPFELRVQGSEHRFGQPRLGQIDAKARKRPFAASWLINGVAVDPLGIG
jgi:hypothetical protein